MPLERLYREYEATASSWFGNGGKQLAVLSFWAKGEDFAADDRLVKAVSFAAKQLKKHQVDRGCYELQAGYWGAVCADTKNERSCFKGIMQPVLRALKAGSIKLKHRQPIILRSLCAWKSVWVGVCMVVSVCVCKAKCDVCVCSPTRDGPEPTIWWLTLQCASVHHLPYFNNSRIHDGQVHWHSHQQSPFLRSAGVMSICSYNSRPFNVCILLPCMWCVL